jgi:hypothetical protein
MSAALYNTRAAVCALWHSATIRRGATSPVYFERSTSTSVWCRRCVAAHYGCGSCMYMLDSLLLCIDFTSVTIVVVAQVMILHCAYVRMCICLGCGALACIPL